MLKLRPEQLEVFRGELREGLADRLVRRCEERYPEVAAGRGDAELRAETVRLAAAARARDLRSEEDVALFHDLSRELGEGFVDRKDGAWARDILEDRARGAHERVRAVRDAFLRIEPVEPVLERSRRALTARTRRRRRATPPSRVAVLERRLSALEELDTRLRSAVTDGKGAVRAGTATLARRVARAARDVSLELFLRRSLDVLARQLRLACDEGLEGTEASKRDLTLPKASDLETRLERTRRMLGRLLDEAEPRRGASDAEDPIVARIETDAVSAREKEQAEAERKRRVAQGLCDLRGEAGEPDRLVVAAELAWMPGSVLDDLRRAGTRVVVCRESVANGRPDLAGRRPRGWPGDADWRNVPGLFDGERNEIVLAMRAPEGKGGVRVPASGEGHSSLSLPLHVACHALDALYGKASGEAAFRAARSADEGRLPPLCRQAGSTGLEETWAEGAARLFRSRVETEKEVPGLCRYLSGRLQTRVLPPEDRDPISRTRELKTTRSRRRPAIGVASLDAEGSIVLDLRASDGRGILGDARLVYAKAHTGYREVLAHLGGLVPGEMKPVPPWPERR